MLTLSLSDPIIKSVFTIVGVPILLILTSLYYKLIRKILIKFFNMRNDLGYDTDLNITSMVISIFVILLATLFIICRR